MGYQNYCCQCNYLATRCAQQKTIVPFNSSIPNYCKCTSSFIPHGCFPNDKMFLVCCQECIIKSPKNVSTLHKDYSSSSNSIWEENPCCCYTQCASLLMKHMLKQTVKRGKQKSHEKYSHKNNRAHTKLNTKEQSSDYDSTDQSHHSTKNSSTSQSPNHKTKDHNPSTANENRRNQRQTGGITSSSEYDIRQKPRETRRKRRTMNDKSSESEYFDQSKNKSKNQKEVIQPIIKRYDDVPKDRRSRQSSTKRYSLPHPKKLSIEKSKATGDLNVPQSTHTNKTKPSKKPQRKHKNKGSKLNQASCDVGLRETEPIFNFEPYTYKTCIGKKFHGPVKKVTVREPNASDLMRVRLEKIDQCLSICNRLPDPCQKPCQPCPPCQACYYHQTGQCSC